MAKRRRIRGLLSNLAQHLKAKVDNGVISCIGPYQNTLSEIARIDLEAAKGAQIRARVQWVEEGKSRRPSSPGGVKSRWQIGGSLL